MVAVADAYRPEQDAVFGMLNQIGADALPQQGQAVGLALVFGPDERTAQFQRVFQIAQQFRSESEQGVGVEALAAMAVQNALRAAGVPLHLEDVGL